MKIRRRIIAVILVGSLILANGTSSYAKSMLVKDATMNYTNTISDTRATAYTNLSKSGQVQVVMEVTTYRHNEYREVNAGYVMTSVTKDVTYDRIYLVYSEHIATYLGVTQTDQIARINE